MKLEGIIPAIHTAFDDRGDLHPGRQADLLERLIAQGVHGVFVGGSTGEFPLLSVEERERLASQVIGAARKRVPVIVHVGALDTRQAVRLARHALREGAAAVSCLPPWYYRPRPQELIEHYRAAAEAAAPLPFYAYHIPEMTGVPMTEDLLSRLLSIPGFRGLKWSDPDLQGLRRTAAILGERGDVLAGRDESLLAALQSGARGAIGSTYNFLAPWFVELWNCFRRGDHPGASAVQARASRVIEAVLRADPGLSSGKAALRWAGVDCGEPRLPLRRFTGEERRAFEAELDRAGLPRGGLPASGSPGSR